MNIYLLDINPKMTEAWSDFFTDMEATIICDSFKHFMDTHPEIDTVVTPANSFGLIDGSYNKAIIDYFGVDLMSTVQHAIIHQWYGEQPVGTALSVPINRMSKKGDNPWDLELIHVPTMRTPEKIADPRIIYQCMRVTLIEAFSRYRNNIVIPAFGGAIGGVDPYIIAKMMFRGYESMVNPPRKLDWDHALHVEIMLSEIF